MKKFLITILILFIYTAASAQFKNKDKLYEDLYYTNDAANILYMSVTVYNNPLRWEQKIYNQFIFQSMPHDEIKGRNFGDTVFNYLPQGRISITVKKKK